MIRYGSYIEKAQAFRSGAISPLELLQDHLRVIDEREGAVKAFVHLARERALREADASAARWRAGKPLSPIDGAAIGVKDIIETVDMPTGQGSPLWEGFETLRDSASVQALREAGAIILGKTTTTEYAFTEPFSGTTNPHDPACTPGGSSSGSAAAVAAGMVPIALGSQVLGSTVRPASFCGCFGYKPTFGALNRGGSYDYLSQSCLGIFSMALGDLWATAKAIATRVGGDPGFPGLAGPEELPARRQPRRVAMLQTGGWAKATGGAREALERHVRTLREVGVDVVDRTQNATLDAFEHELTDALDLGWRVLLWELRWPIATYARRDRSRVSPAMLARLADAERMSQGDYVKILARREALRARYRELMQEFDAAIALSALGAAPVGLESTGDPSMNVPASLLGAPALSLPVLSDQGMPLGLQLIGRANEDAELFGIAAWMNASHGPGAR